MLTRSEILQAIENSPGINSLKLVEQFGVPKKTIESHLRGLQKSRLVVAQAPAARCQPYKWFAPQDLDAEAIPFVQRIIPAKGAPALRGLGPASVWEWSEAQVSKMGAPRAAV